MLHVIDSLGGSGGAEHGLVREIARFDRFTEQLVVRLFAKDQLSERLAKAGIPVQALGFDSASAGWLWPIAVMRLRSVLRRFAPDVVHSSLFTSNLVAQLAARSLAIPVLSTFTLSGDEALLRAHQPGAASVKAAVLRRVAAHAARSPLVYFRALTTDARSTNCQLLGISPDRVTVIPRGVPEAISEPPAQSRAEIGLPEDRAVILNIGRQTSQKGHVHLVRAFARLRQGKPCHLVIVGREGDATTALHAEIAQHGLGDDVSLVGYSPHVRDYLGHADVFVFSSLMEGLGTAVLEAMAAGVPVVAFDIPPVREITGEGEFAMLVPVGDEAVLADAMSSALSGDYQAIVPKARAHVSANYSLASIAARLETRLMEVAALG